MEESRRRSVELAVLAAQAIGTLGLLGLAVYGVFFSDLSDAVRARLETTIAEERQENVELRHERRVLQGSIDSLEQRRRELISEISQLRIGWNRYLGQIYDGFLHDFRNRVSDELDRLESRSQQAAAYGAYKRWLAAGHRLRNRVLKQKPPPPDTARYEKNQARRERLKAQSDSMINKLRSLAEQGELNRAMSLRDSIHIITDKAIALVDSADKYFHNRQIELSRWELSMRDSARAWIARRPSAWDPSSIQRSLTERLNRLGQPDTSDRDEASTPFQINSHAERLNEFERRITGPPESAETGTELFTEALNSGVLGRFLPRHQQKLREAVSRFTRENSQILEKPLQVRLSKPWSSKDVEQWASTVLEYIKAVRETVSDLQSFLQNVRSTLLR